MGYPWRAHGSLVGCTYIREAYVGRPWVARGVSAYHTGGVRGSLVRCPRGTHGLAVRHQRGKCTWGAQVMYVRRPWGFRGMYMSELSLGHLWGIREAPMGFP